MINVWICRLDGQENPTSNITCEKCGKVMDGNDVVASIDETPVSAVEVGNVEAPSTGPLPSPELPAGIQPSADPRS